MPVHPLRIRVVTRSSWVSACVAVVAAAIPSPRTCAEIITSSFYGYSGPYARGDTGPVTFSIAGYSWTMNTFGWADLPEDPGRSWVISVSSPAAGIFTTSSDSRFARKFRDGDVVGPAVGGLKMFEGSEINRVLQSANHDYDPYDAGGEFGRWETGHLGFAFGTQGHMNYGWIKVKLDLGWWGYDKQMQVLGWAYNDVVNAAIVVPGPGVSVMLTFTLCRRARRRV